MTAVPIVVAKAFVYVTRRDRDLLVMAHPDHPEAGLQVPAGTIEEAETPARAAARELAEETGLAGFGMMIFLGEETFDMRPFGKAELHRRFFYRTGRRDEARDRWFHVENHAGDRPIRLELFWWPLANGFPPLVAGHGALLDRLVCGSIG